jgi:hypothetical protein
MNKPCTVVLSILKRELERDFARVSDRFLERLMIIYEVLGTVNDCNAERLGTFEAKT